MLSYIPAFVALTFAIMIALAPQHDRIETSLPQTTSANMMTQHRAAYGKTVADDLSAGFVNDAYMGPMADMGGWKSKIILTSGRKVLVTYGTSEANFATNRRAAGFLSNNNPSGLPDTFGGLLKRDGSEVKIGTEDVSDLSLDLVENTPVIVTILETYAGGGGVGEDGGGDIPADI